MAVLTPDELAEMRRDVTRRFAEQDWDRLIFNAAVQGLEDNFEITTRGVWRGVITSAVAPLGYVPTDEFRDAVVAAFMKQKARREGA